MVVQSQRPFSASFQPYQDLLALQTPDHMMINIISMFSQQPGVLSDPVRVVFGLVLQMSVTLFVSGFLFFFFSSYEAGRI